MLYWFRTPPNIKVGRSPFAPEIRRALEAQNPDVAFDWEAIVRTPIPPPMEPERWRERRRVERALKASETEEAAAIADAIDPSPAETSMPVVQAIEEAAHESLAVEAVQVNETAEPVVTSKLTSAATPEGGMPRQGRRRRRRRGRRRPQQVQESGFQVPGSELRVQSPQAEGSQSQELTAQDPEEPGNEEP